MKSSIFTSYWECYPQAKDLAVELIEHRCALKRIQTEIQRICNLPTPSMGTISRLRSKLAAEKAKSREEKKATGEDVFAKTPSPDPSPKTPTGCEPGSKGKRPGKKQRRATKKALRKHPEKGFSAEKPFSAPLAQEATKKCRGARPCARGNNGNGRIKCHADDEDNEKTILIVPRGPRSGRDHTARELSGTSPARHFNFTPFRLTKRLLTIKEELPEHIQLRLNRDNIGGLCRHEGVSHLSRLACLARQVAGLYKHTIKTGTRGADGYDTEMITPSLMACDGCPLFLSREENHTVKTALKKAAKQEARAAR